MMRPYDFKDVGRVTRILQALLPETVKVLAQATRGGWIMSITLCGKASCETYEIKPNMNDRELLSLSLVWATGEFVAPPKGEDKSVVAAIAADRHITSRNDFISWSRESKHASKIVYFHGNLAQFRFDAPRRVVQLQALSDKSRPSKPRPVDERIELSALQERLSLLEAINNIQRANVIDVFQVKSPDGSGATYYAVKR